MRSFALLILGDLRYCNFLACGFLPLVSLHGVLPPAAFLNGFWYCFFMNLVDQFSSGNLCVVGPFSVRECWTVCFLPFSRICVKFAFAGSGSKDNFLNEGFPRIRDSWTSLR